MLCAIVSVALSLLALAGIAFTILSGSILSVDGLFFTLILGAVFAIFGFNSLRELRGWRIRRREAQPKKAAPGVERRLPAAAEQRPAPVVEGFGTGTVLVNDAAPLPGGIGVQPCFAAEADGVSHAAGCESWKRVEGENGASLERPLRQGGLDIFFPVGQIEGIGWAFNRKSATAKALRRVLATVEAQGRNGVEIARASAVRLLFLHRVNRVAHLRHIQRTPLLLERPGTPQRAPSPREITSANGKATPARAA